MRWEEDRRDTRKYPCRQSTYTVVHSSNDWGQHNQNWIMECQNCRDTYVLYTYSYPVNEIHAVERGNVWVPRQEKEDIDDLAAKLRTTKERISTLARQRYRSLWLLHFDGKTRAATWRELTTSGTRGQSQSTFYKDLRHRTLKRHLDGYFAFEQLPILIEILGIKDDDISEAIEEASVLQREQDEIVSALVKKGIH